MSKEYLSADAFCFVSECENARLARGLADKFKNNFALMQVGNLIFRSIPDDFDEDIFGPKIVGNQLKFRDTCGE